MTLPGESAVAGLPVQASALEPAWVRHGTPAVQKQYAAAVQFEQMLLTQMASSLTQNGELGGEGSGEEGEGGSSSEPGAGVYSSMLPQALASGVVSGGGLGLAAELTRQLAGSAAGTPATTTAAGTGDLSTAAPLQDGGIAAPSGTETR
jgi:Rod binding domain-containing protein